MIELGIECSGPVAAHLGKDQEAPPDAVIFLGPKLVFERNPSQALIRMPDALSVPVFYMIYNRNPRSYPWRDALSVGLKDLDVEEYDVTDAKDFGLALQRLMHSLRKPRT